MSTVNDNKQKTEDILQLVSFKIGTEEFGVDILRVQEINRMLQITTVPNTPKFIEGVINLRGKVIPVVDLRVKFGMPKLEHDSQTRIVVVELENKTVGFIVDEVSEVLRIPRNITEPPPEMVSGINSNFITAVGKLDDRLIILLDLEKTLSMEEMAQLEAV